MVRFPDKTELSIIIPVLNEAGIVQGLLRNLAEQKDVDFEVIVCDGGSTDGTRDKLTEAAPDCFFPVTIVTCEKGRGRQLNEGAEAARGSFLLFLHADSLFRDESALRKALDALVSAMELAGHERVAGRFALRFEIGGETSPLFFYFHESKARLDRCECIHGDQGFLLSRSFFRSVGRFEESVPALEDMHFAERVRKGGQWILLPCEVFTSPRRFEREGLVEREILNALVMTLSAVGRVDIIKKMPRIYSGQDQARRLRLFPFFREIRKLVNVLPVGERISFWISCGAYALRNSWQLAFVLDVRRNYRAGVPPGEGYLHWLGRFDRYIFRVTQRGLLEPCAVLLVWLWFHVMLIGSYAWEKRTRVYM